MFHAGNESRPADERDRRFATQHDAQQVIEAGEVVHVGMRDEHVRQPHQLAGRQHRDVPEVEQQRAALVAEVDV